MSAGNMLPDTCFFIIIFTMLLSPKCTQESLRCLSEMCVFVLTVAWLSVC